MRKTLEDIAKQIHDIFLKEKELTRFGFSEKYTTLFNDYVYESTVNNYDVSLHDLANKLSRPLFIYNQGHTELFVVSPIFALLLGVNQESNYEELNLDEWLSRDFWGNNLPKSDDINAKLKYQNILGDIPEFMARLKKKEDDLAIEVLRSRYLFNLEKNPEFLMSEHPNIFRLEHSDPIHLVRFLMSSQRDN